MFAHVLHSRTCVLRANTVSNVLGMFILRKAVSNISNTCKRGPWESYTEMYVESYGEFANVAHDVVGCGYWLAYSVES